MSTYKAKLGTERKYYKYSDSAFTTPTLTKDWDVDNTGFGVETPAVFGTNYAYKAFDKVATTVASIANIPSWLLMYNEKPLKLSSITIDNYSAYFARSGSVDVSNDGSTWTELTTWTSNDGTNAQWSITLNVTDYYNYYRINFATSTSTYVYIKEITLNGLERTITEGTASDYDFYVDVPVYRVINNNGYYAIRG